MRFQVIETIDTLNDEMVLCALERCLQDVSMEVIRKRGQITFHGFGLSSHPENPQDTAVLFVEVEDNSTVIKAYVKFEESALLGEEAQGEVVRSKLDQVFRHVREQLEKTLDPPGHALTAGSASIGATPEIEPIEAEHLELFPRIRTLEAAVEAEPLPSTHEPNEGYAEIESTRIWGSGRAAALVSAISALVLVMVGAYLIGFYHQRKSSKNVAVESHPLETHDSLASNRREITAAETKSPGTAPVDPSAKSEINVGDPYVWLQGWVAAMRTRDAATQASFYADPVDQYLNELNVSKDAMLKEKQAAIADRKGLWTIKLEKIVIERPSPSEATVHLVKHLIDQPKPAKISERFVRARFTLKQMAGGWKITSEQDLP